MGSIPGDIKEHERYMREAIDMVSCILKGAFSRCPTVSDPLAYVGRACTC
jgi:hypothetical protein